MMVVAADGQSGRTVRGSVATISAVSVSPLSPADFGVFEPRLLGFFEQLFAFSWHPSPDEPPDAAALRERFERIVRGGTSAPPNEPARALELVRRAYELRADIVESLDPRVRLQKPARRVVAEAAGIMKQLARLHRDLTRKEGSNPSRSTTIAGLAERIAEVAERWRAIVAELEQAQLAVAVEEMQPPLVRIAESAKCAQVSAGLAGNQLRETEARIAGLEDVVVSQRRIAIGRIAQACAVFAASAGELAREAREARPLPASWSAYFSRLVDDLLVRAETVADGLPPRRIQIRYEVPRAGLTLPRDRGAQRDVLVAWLATLHPEFFGALPASARSDNGAPVTKGGRGYENRVLRGVAAALVLTGLADREPGDEGVEGARLFDRLVKRVVQSLARGGVRGEVRVDASIEDPEIRERLARGPGGSWTRTISGDVARPPLVDELELRWLPVRILHKPEASTVEVPEGSGSVGNDRRGPPPPSADTSVRTVAADGPRPGPPARRRAP